MSKRSQAVAERKAEQEAKAAAEAAAAAAAAEAEAADAADAEAAAKAVSKMRALPAARHPATPHPARWRRSADHAAQEGKQGQ